MRELFIRGIVVWTVFAGSFLFVPGVLADDSTNPVGAPANTDAGRENAELAQTIQPFGQVVQAVAHVGLVDDLSHQALDLIPPR